MDFREATDRLSPCVTQEAIAEEAGVSRDTIKKARFPADSDHYRSPPKGWRKVLSRLARAKSHDLLAVADALDADEE